MADPRRLREILGFGYGAPSPAMSALEPFHAGVDPQYMPQDVVTESPWEGPRSWVRSGLESLFGTFAPSDNAAAVMADKYTNLSDWINPAQAGWDIGQEAGNTLQGGDPRMLAMSLIPGKAGKTAKKAASTLKDKITDALTYKHPISGVKLRTPIEHMNPTYEPMGEMLPEKLIHPEALFGGHVIPMRGDPTIAGQRLTGVGGQMFERPVDLHGGPNFARGQQQVAEGMGWASNPPPSTALSKTAVRLGREGDPVFGAYMKMSPESGDYATHMTETLNQMFKLNPVSPEGQAAFDDIMRRDWGSLNKKTGKYEFPAIPDFPGIANLDDDWINNAGKGRTKIAKLMDSKRFGDLGFPEVGVARHATTEPDLLNTPTNTSGHSVVRFDPLGQTTREPIIPHPTYGQQNKASYEGRLPELPLEVLYGPDVMKGVNPSHVSKILETKPPSVKVDQQTLDRVMAYLRSRDGAKWGLGGAVAAGLLSQEQANEMEQPQT